MSPIQEHGAQAANRIFEQEVVAKRNIAALDRVYTAAARLLPPGAAMISGREAIKSFWQNAMEGMNVVAARLETVEFEEHGDTAYEIGNATLELAMPDAPPMTAKYVVVWKREDGEWKWNVDIWNANG